MLTRYSQSHTTSQVTRSGQQTIPTPLTTHPSIPFHHVTRHDTLFFKVLWRKVGATVVRGRTDLQTRSRLRLVVLCRTWSSSSKKRINGGSRQQSSLSMCSPNNDWYQSRYKWLFGPVLTASFSAYFPTPSPPKTRAYTHTHTSMDGGCADGVTVLSRGIDLIRREKGSQARTCWRRES